MTDTHTHLYMEDFAGDEVGAVERAINAGVTRMVFPGVSPESHEAMMALHKKFPKNTRVAIGLHPTELGDDYEITLVSMERELERGGFSAIGEIGIDLHWDASNVEVQKGAFSRQLELAKRYKLPVIIHCRDGVDETLEVIRDAGPDVPVLIFHSFTGDISDVRKIREVCDPFFGINGVVTFKNADTLREALPEIGIGRILLETDSPYLAPVPLRGKRNESSYIPIIRDKVAEILGIPPEEVEKITDSNADGIFRWPAGSYYAPAYKP